jgi:hypothetical protein
MAYDFHPVQRPGRRVTRYEAPSSIEGPLELLDEYG